MGVGLYHVFANLAPGRDLQIGPEGPSADRLVALTRGGETRGVRLDQGVPAAETRPEVGGGVAVGGAGVGYDVAGRGRAGVVGVDHVGGDAAPVADGPAASGGPLADGLGLLSVDHGRATLAGLRVDDAALCSGRPVSAGSFNVFRHGGL